MTADLEETVIIGGGIHGVSTALALASRGRRSLILEAGQALLQGASVRNEGKVHLGFVYGLDGSGSTTDAMVEGSLTFAPLVESWCGEIGWERMRSDPFGYVVMDEGLAGPDHLESHYESVLDAVRAAESEFGSNYLGVDLRGATLTRHDEVFPGMAAGHSGCWFDTPEMAIDPVALAGVIERTVKAEPLIRVLTAHKVVSAKRLEGGFALEVETVDGKREMDAGPVVNCAWDGRPTLDQMILGKDQVANYRVKYSVTVRGGQAPKLRASTLAQGPFGDVVPWPGGGVYISWYPAARTYFGDQPLENLEADPGVAERVHAAIQELFPALEDFRVDRYAPCYILADGRTDIGDRESRLHTRGGAEFVTSDGWWSIRSSKLTTAPLAGERCAASITGIESVF